MNSALLIGNGFAILAAALQIASRGQEVILLNDGKPLGGHFAGLHFDGFDFDIGMVLLEECHSTELGASLGSYDPNKRNDWTRFGDLASAWVRSNVGLIKARTPECLFDGRLVADYLISNRLDGLKDWPSALQLSTSDPRHASHKCECGVFDSMTYAEAALLNHGHDWHQTYVEPFVKKVLGVPSSDFLARFHRVGWAPLYYPETLNLAAKGQPTGLSEYPFWTTPNGFVGQLVRNLCNSLSRFPNVKLNTHPLTSISLQQDVWTITTADKKIHQSRRLGIGMTPERIGTLLDVPVAAPLPAATVSLFFAVVDSELIRTSHGCTMIVDDTYAAYRLTDQDAVAGVNTSWHRIVLEASPMNIARLHPGKTVESALMNEMESLLGMDLSDSRDRNGIRMLRCFTAQNTLPIPTAKQVSRASETSSLIAQAAQGATLTGSLLGYGVASLNDQIVQALKISEEFA